MALKIGSIELGPVKSAFLRVAAKVNGESLRARIGKILEGHFTRFSKVYAREVAYLARAYGVSWDEAFTLLASDRPSPFKKPYTDADLQWARNQVHLVREADVADGGGLGIALDSQIFAQLAPGQIPADVGVALEEGLRAGLAGKEVELGDLSAYAIGCRLAAIAKEILEERENGTGANDRPGDGS